MQNISASIVVYNTDEEILEESISSYLDAEYSGELWIIDNTANGRYNYLANKYDRIHYYLSDENLGYGKAHNIAIRHFLEKTKYHLVLNPDVSFTGDVIKELLIYLENNERTGLIAPKAEYPDGSLQSNGRLIPSPGHLLFRRFFSDKKDNDDINNRYELKFNQEEPYQAPVILGSFMLFRNSALREVGLFDERFFLYPEDIDISRRMFEKYKNIIYTERNFIHHHEQASYKDLKTLWIHSKEMIKYFNKWGWFIDACRSVSNNKVLKGYI
ncbi:MAG: glycosyltransferase [Bacteroidota bacterium]